MDHIVVRERKKVWGTPTYPEVTVFVQTKTGSAPTPYPEIAVGDRVWMKWITTPELVAFSVVTSFTLYPDCTPDELREAVSGYGLAKVEEFWDEVREKAAPLYGLVVELDGHPLKKPHRLMKSVCNFGWCPDPDGSADWPTE